MVRMRIYGVLADYADQNDHDTLRSDPVFKLIAGRSPHDEDLASQPTLSRFENAIDVPSLWRLRDVLIDQFIASFQEPPGQLTFDIDVFDDPTHGQQQLTFFHGYYDQYQYLPRVISCAPNDLVVMVCLLYGTAHPALGADEDLAYLVGRLRAVWPDVQIEVRGDSGFGVPSMYEVGERLNLFYTFGLRLNPVLKANSEASLAYAVAQYEKSGQPQRLFCSFWYRAGSWPACRWVEVKLAGRQRRRYFNRRRQQDPLGEGHPCTWQTRLIKVAAQVFVRSRRIIVRLSASWPYLEHYRQVSEHVLRMPPIPSLKPG
jgi:hypothetical protein